MSRPVIVRCVASALKIRSLPVISDATDTGRRMVYGQAAVAYGQSWDQKWFYVEAPSGSGWASSDYLILAPKAPTQPSWTRIPSGLVDLRNVYGDPTPFVDLDKDSPNFGAVSDEWVKQVTAGRVRFISGLPLAWKPEEKVYGFSCHPLVVDRFQSAFDEVHRRGYWHLLEDFGGCYNFRPARGLSKLSTHCWGIAVDIAVNNNPLGSKPKLDPRIVGIFEDRGLVWGGHWKRPDGMHFQAVTDY